MSHTKSQQIFKVACHLYLNAQLQKIGKPMPIMDSLIASSCLAKGFILITRNEKDFYSFEMDMINPF